MTLFPSWKVQVACGIGIVLASYYCARCYVARSWIWEKQKQGLPVAPGHSFLFGHLLYFKSYLDKLPSNAHYQSALGDIAREHFQNEGCYYIDLWPVSGIIMVIVSPHITNQIHANPQISMQRPTLLPRFFYPIAGGPNLFDMREHEWKPWRGVFSGAFSSQHVMTLVPGMVVETEVYVQRLKQLAEERKMFYLDLVTLRFTFDVIGKTILNAHLGAQKGYNTLADCMLSQIRWHQPNSEGNPLEHLNLVRKAVHWWNGKRMDRYIGKELDKRYSEYIADPDSKRTKAVIDLVLQGHLAESQGSKSKAPPNRLDPKFRAFATSQIRLFSFVGHDSTSSTICYIMHLLSTHPEALAKLTQEHDQLLGTDLSKAAPLLKDQPHLTNNLPYTTAVIKESLRLYAPGGCSRSGQPTVSLRSDSGKDCPTKNVEAVFTIHTELQRSPAYWVQPDAFLPERWLVDQGHPLFPIKGSYRAFEIGPRNCVAQGFVMTELKVILALIVRRFEFKPAYDEWDRMHPAKKTELRRYRGDRAYQIEEGAAHPAEHYPCRVSIRDTKQEKGD